MQAAERRANTLNELSATLRTCLRVGGGPAGAQITIRFALKRDGSLLGRPKITFSALPREDAERQRFVAGVAGALARCLPVPITDSLGSAIAGRPFTFRLIVPAPTTGT